MAETPNITTGNTTEGKRPSLSKCLQDRYNNEHTGGAFDAKGDLVGNSAGGNEKSLAGNEGNTGYYDTRWSKTKGFKTKMRDTDQKDPLGSQYVKGHSTTKYTKNSPHITDRPPHK
jgi:hypothetical protein